MDRVHGVNLSLCPGKVKRTGLVPPMAGPAGERTIH